MEEAVTAVGDVVDQLPGSELQRNAVKIVEAVEEIVLPEQLAEKRLKRKQQRARYVGACATYSLRYLHAKALALIAECGAGSKQYTRFLRLLPLQL